MGILSSLPMSVEFDAATLARLARLATMGTVFAAYMESAMNYSVNLVATRARQNAASDFQNPSGTLMRGIQGRVVNPWTGLVGVGEQVPYARRRELGFSGMTDSLGRYYSNDPGVFYLRRALEASRPEIAGVFHAQTALAIRSVIW